jgi:putative addiction module component (TIGR02574 family)
MAPTMKELGIDQLSIDDRLALLEEIWESISATPEQLPVTDEQKQLLDRRVAELKANPENVLTWEQIKSHVLRQPRT